MQDKIQTGGLRRCCVGNLRAKLHRRARIITTLPTHADAIVRGVILRWEVGRYRDYRCCRRVCFVRYVNDNNGVVSAAHA
jgi:hypothetical protein